MQFNYYNLYDSGDTKNKEDLKKAIITFLDILQDYYEMDGKCFPSGININYIQTYLLSLKSNCPNLEDQKIFDMFIWVINGKRFDFSEFFNTQNASINPKILTTKGISVLKSAEGKKKIRKKKY